VGALAEPARRDLYEYVVSQADAVSREQAADAVGLPAHSAKFHLDKLAGVGLLDVEYRRLSGRTGPGAGRPAKLYRPATREVAVSVPPRRYDLVGEVLAEAVDRAGARETPVLEEVRAVAREAGQELGAAAEAARTDGDVARAAEVLARHGYRPEVQGEELRLCNCPFDRLAADHTTLVCGMNLALIEGVLEGLELAGLTAHLAPSPGYCCVALRG
jgi:predicted ArsR family transcriptional regulator